MNRPVCSSLLALTALWSCAHQGAPAAPLAAAAPAAPAAAAAAPAVAAAPAGAPCTGDAQCHSDQICMQAHCTQVSAALDQCGEQRVAFSFNAAEMGDDQKDGLVRAAHCLMGHQAFKLTIEGNADERGTEEYNLALGQMRARNVAKYLEALGASEAQLKTISYGKDQPMCTAHDEACWAKNRQAALRVRSAASD